MAAAPRGDIGARVTRDTSGLPGAYAVILSNAIGWNVTDEGKITSMPVPLQWSDVPMSFQGLFNTIPADVDHWNVDSNACQGGRGGYGSIGSDLRTLWGRPPNLFIDFGLGTANCTSAGTYYFILADPNTRQNVYIYSIDWNGVYPLYKFTYTNGLGFGPDVDGNLWNIWSANGSLVWDWQHKYVGGYLHYQFKVYDMPGLYCSGSCRYHNIWGKDPTEGFNLADVVHDSYIFPESNQNAHTYRVDIQWNATGYHAFVFDLTDNLAYSEQDYFHSVTSATHDSWTWGYSYWGLPPYETYPDEEPSDHATNWRSSVSFADSVTGTSGGGDDVRTDALPVMEPVVTTGAISVSSDLQAATFTISGPATYQGSGQSFSVSSAPAGSYTISYGAVAGYSTPAPETQTLSAGGQIAFSGVYTNPSGSLSVTTNLAAATFTINGPSTYSGNGTSFSVGAAPAGTYTITFGGTTGYAAPAPETKVLSPGGVLSFSGTYVAMGSLGVKLNTNQGGFTVQGALGSVLDVSGSSAQTYGPVPFPSGTYTISFHDTASRTFTPAPQSFTVSGGSLTQVSASYQRLILTAFTGFGNAPADPDCFASPIGSKVGSGIMFTASKAGAGMTSLLATVQANTIGRGTIGPVDDAGTSVLALTFYGHGIIPSTSGPTKTEDGNACFPPSGTQHYEAERTLMNQQPTSPWDRIAIVGHSYGGYRAALFAKQLIDNRNIVPDVLITVDGVNWDSCNLGDVLTKLKNRKTCDQQANPPLLPTLPLSVFRYSFYQTEGESRLGITLDLFGFTMPNASTQQASVQHTQIDDDAGVTPSIAAVLAQRMRLPRVIVTPQTPARSAGSINLVATLSATGLQTSAGIQITGATLNGVAATNLSAVTSQGDMAFGASRDIRLTFPDAAVKPGKAGTLVISGVFNGNQTFSLPIGFSVIVK